LAWAASLSAAGLHDYIASDPDHYVELAIARASDLPALAELRMTLRERIAGTAFGDPVRYAQAVEGQYRSMWRRWCAQQRGGA
jgi:predicted O-linked N-acetylglucosamine transferase (SPINDLY family)